MSRMIWAARRALGRRVVALTGTAAAAIAAVLVIAVAAAAQPGGAHRPPATPAAAVPGLPVTAAPDAGQPGSPPAGAAVTGHLVPAAGQPSRHACGDPAPGQMACLALVNSYRGAPQVSSGGRTATSSTGTGPQPYLAADLRAAYRLPAVPGGGRPTIAIVDAFDDPSAAADLDAYRTANHLPSCSTSPCFRKVAQDGSTNYPAPDAGWSTEISLDLDMASAICPTCKLLLVEASNSDVINLGLAVDEAATLGATVISNSYGAPEFSTEQAYARHWDHPGIVVVASTGDAGFGVQVPAAYPSVVAVGGTTLYHSRTSRGWSERAWAFAGSGCSAYIAKPPWQPGADCAKRTVADVSAVADPDTPVWVYDTFGTGTTWIAVGGTSVSAPIIGGVYALAGNAASITPGRYLAAHHSQLFDVTTGANGFCGGGYLCAAKPGYDGPTGWGSPDGLGAF